MLEFVLLLGLLPLLLASGWVRLPLLPLLWLASLYCAWRLRRDGKLGSRSLATPQGALGEWRRVLSTFALATPLLTLAVLITRPQALFALPLHHPLAWAAVMALFPPLSALPQELVFRALFFDRYRFLLGSGVWLVVGSAVAFALTHLVFHNWITGPSPSPAACCSPTPTAGRGGLLLVAAEHALSRYWCSRSDTGGCLAEGTARMLH